MAKASFTANPDSIRAEGSGLLFLAPAYANTHTTHTHQSPKRTRRTYAYTQRQMRARARALVHDALAPFYYCAPLRLLLHCVLDLSDSKTSNARTMLLMLYKIPARWFRYQTKDCQNCKTDPLGGRIDAISARATIDTLATDTCIDMPGHGEKRSSVR